MNQEYLDSIGLFQRFCHPHILLTMTYNPQWPEIKDNSKDDETALDRPDLVS